MTIQLPNDATAAGYKQTRPFHYEQVFHSNAAQFTGTELEFLKAGHAYKFVQVDQFTRAILES
jgi:hypothetical protein